MLKSHYFSSNYLPSTKNNTPLFKLNVHPSPTDPIQSRPARLLFSKFSPSSLFKPRYQTSIALSSEKPLKDHYLSDCEVINENGWTYRMDELMRGTQIIVVQPGESSPGQWDGEEGQKALSEWKNIPGAAGCGKQNDWYNHFYQTFSNLHHCQILVIMAHKSPKNLCDLKKKYPNLSFYTLTEKSEDIIKKHHPCFTFRTKIYPHRFTFIVTNDDRIFGFDRHELIPTELESLSTLSAFKKILQQRNLSSPHPRMVG